MSMFLVHFVTTFLITGMMWFIQLIHYPLLADIGKESFVEYEKRHTRLAVGLVVSLMIAESITGVGLVWRRPTGITLRQTWMGLGLLSVIGWSTFVLQVPQHRRLASGFNAASHRKLVSSNWIRTVCYTARAVLVLWMLLTSAGWVS